MSQSFRIAVILPSRGLMFSQTADELLQNLQGYEYDIFYAHGLPIPDCFEKPTTEALNGSYTHLWYVEDDMILPEDTLNTMLLMDAPVVACDYPVTKTGQGTVFKDASQRVVFTGTGCLLVKRGVFEKLSKPYFRTDIKWRVANYGDFIRFEANKVPNLEGYGLHDVTFGIKLWEAGIPISVSDSIGQRKLIALGQAGSNDGAHQIEEWTKIKPDYLYKHYRKMPKQPIGKLVSVMTKDGEVAVHPSHAKKLVAAKVAEKIKRQSVSIDYNDVKI